MLKALHHVFFSKQTSGVHICIQLSTAPLPQSRKPETSQDQPFILLYHPSPQTPVLSLNTVCLSNCCPMGEAQHSCSLCLSWMPCHLLQEDMLDSQPPLTPGLTVPFLISFLIASFSESSKVTRNPKTPSLEFFSTLRAFYMIIVSHDTGAT